MAFPFPLESYAVQKDHWPVSGRNIVAHYDDTTVVVYQAYKPSIGHPAALHQDFVTSNPEFRPSRMTWIKPSFLWMMYRSGWGTKQNQEITLAISLSRQWFEEILETKAELASHSAADTGRSENAKPQVVVQWDPDHDPLGRNETRRAIQIGMRDETAQEFAKGVRGRGVLAIHDVSEFVRRAKTDVVDHGWEAIEERLQIPVEKIYPVGKLIHDRLQMSNK